MTLPAWSREVAELTHAELVELEGAGHAPQARDPVVVNRLVHDFLRRNVGTGPTGRPWARGAARPRRALFLSSPIGLGHVRRDLAIARGSRERIDGLHIDWLTQPPVTGVLADAGETLHPACRWLTSESAHLMSHSGEHDLHVFQSFRDMDEILVANFMIFQEAVEDGTYDLVVADEAWDVDQFWHEHPELQRAPLAWLTDFVGFLPMPEGGAAEAALTADYNAEMFERVERFARVRTTPHTPHQAPPTIRTRALAAGETAPVEEVFAGLSPHSRLLRFHAPVPRLTASWCRSLTAVDGRRHAAIVAEAFVDGRWAAVGIARIAATGPGTAELAFAVVDAWHGRGIGGRLVDEAACLAVDLGHERLTALVLRENARARALLRSRFPDATVTGRGAAQEFLIPLPTMSLAPTGALEYIRGALAVDRRNQSRALVRSQTSGRPAAVCA